MSEIRCVLALEFRDDAIRKLLPKLNAPLVKRVDTPDRSLRENAVLVEGDEAPKGTGAESFGNHHCRRSVALERPMGNEPFRYPFFSYILGALAKRKGLSLSKDVCR